MKKLSFHKMSGAGNDFILFDRRDNPELNLDPDLIKRFCDRKFGIGADGILRIGESSQFDFSMEYFNADGSAGSLCGNGARCALKYSSEYGLFNNSQAAFECNNENYKGEIIADGNVKFYLNEPTDTDINFQISAHNQNISCSFIDTGSPHVVIEIDNILKCIDVPQSYFKDISEIPVVKMGREIRNHKKFPNGTNVNFISADTDQIIIRTYERGVEDETLACGTGSVASALIQYLKNKIEPPIKVLTMGGATLIIDFKFETNRFSNISLTGPAKIVFSGQIKL